MQYTYFPVTLEQLGATIRYHDLVEGAFDVGEIRVRTRYLNHPALTLAYRLEADGVTIVYSSDHEPHSRQLATGPGDVSGEDRRHAEFLAGADLVIHDAQYTAGEYPAKTGWGHSTVEYAGDLAHAAGVRRLALFHHDPLRDDEAMDRVVEALRARLAAAGAPLEVFAAAEGQTVELPPAVRPDVPQPRGEISAVTSPPPALLEHSVLVGVGEPATAVLLSEAARADGIRLLLASDGDGALRIAEAERPSLLILEHRLSGRDGLEVCRALRRGAGAYGEDVPVVIVAPREDPADRAAGAAAGVSDWLVQPFSSIYARTRMRAWLLRRACRWMRAPLAENEHLRLRALRHLGVLDTEPEERFDRLTRLAAALFDVPIALVSLVDADRQWFKSCHGLGMRETPRETSFCAHVILGGDVMVVPDALLDSRFADNPLVTGEPRVRFYAGCPLALTDGSRAGTLCLMDTRPRHLDESAIRLLRDLAGLVQQELSGRGTPARSASADPARHEAG